MELMYKMVIAGLNEKAEKYLEKNKFFIAEEYIGCKNSDGIFYYSAKTYETKIIKNSTIFLFEYDLQKGKVKEKVQVVKDNFIFIYLETEVGKKIKWTKKEMDVYINNNSKGEV